MTQKPRRRHLRTHSLPWLLVAVAVLCFATGVAADGLDVVKASATFASCTAGTTVTGRATLIEKPTPEGVKEVLVTLFIQGLPAGKHAVHIHSVASCANSTNAAGVVTACGGAGSHFDPGPFGNTAPVEANHPFHLGDLINVNVNSRGQGAMATVTSRVTLSPGVLSVFDADGSAIVIHTGTDTYCPDGNVAGCAGGSRAACGVLTLDP
jgi:superoxide dismutase, Cu-Zn family